MKSLSVEPVSQFKFACPVCGQHLQARREEAGRTIECPSCFKKLKVPHAPTEAGGALLIKASLADSRRSKRFKGDPSEGRSDLQPFLREPLVFAVGAAAALALVVGAVLYVENSIGGGDSAESPTSKLWTDDVGALRLVESPLAGWVSGMDFTASTGTWKGTTLSLIQQDGDSAPVSLEITFPLKGGELVRGKSFQVGEDDPPFELPIRVRWQDANASWRSRYYTSGYVLLVRFDEVSPERVSGRIHLCLPDPDRGWVAGSFSAEVRTRGP